VLQNLISNALKFHREGVAPLVTVSAELVNRNDNNRNTGEAQPQLCQITVRDNGIGFDEKYTEQIFQPFQRLFARGEYEGTGMGLAICKRIVERHGGSITAHSVPAQGARFVLTFPVQQKKEAA
ncbi:MAG: ATP-binding protein, partial [Candidatus Binatia bacterium]